MQKSLNFINEVQLEFEKKLFSVKKVTTSADAAEISREIYHATYSKIELKEYFFIIMLNRANEVLGYTKVGEGGVSSTLVDMKLAFATAIKCLASGIILLHNHPSSQLRPSEQDIQLTKSFSRLGDVLDIRILDHIIITAHSYCSFSDEGICMR